MGNVVEAANDYNRALQINPRYDVAYIGRGNLYQAGGAHQRGEARLQSRHQPGDDRPACLPQPRADQAACADQHTQAIEDFSDGSISLAPNSPEPYNGRGISYVALNDDENAFADFNRAIELDQRVAESWANQALIYERRGRLDDVLDHLLGVAEQHHRVVAEEQRRCRRRHSPTPCRA
jgi:tetratricopeptide (TPR) repeat protein